MDNDKYVRMGLALVDDDNYTVYEDLYYELLDEGILVDPEIFFK